MSPCDVWCGEEGNLCPWLPSLTDVLLGSDEAVSLVSVEYLCGAGKEYMWCQIMYIDCLSISDCLCGIQREESVLISDCSINYLMREMWGVNVSEEILLFYPLEVERAVGVVTDAEGSADRACTQYPSDRGQNCSDTLPWRGDCATILKLFWLCLKLWEKSCMWLLMTNHSITEEDTKYREELYADWLYLQVTILGRYSGKHREVFWLLCNDHCY